jgi:hypothetical protein
MLLKIILTGMDAQRYRSARKKSERLAGAL